MTTGLKDFGILREQEYNCFASEGGLGLRVARNRDPQMVGRGFLCSLRLCAESNPLLELNNHCNRSVYGEVFRD